MGPPATEDRPDSAPLTPAQDLFLTGQALLPDSPLYNMGWRFDLMLELDPDRFSRAFAAAVASLDGMRTVIDTGGGTPIQRLVPAAPGPVPVVDLASSPAPSAAADDWIAGRVGRRFDLSARTHDTALLKLGPARWVWYFNQHHIATDAHSASILFQAVSEAYQSQDGGAAAPGERPSFLAYAQGLAGALDTPDLAAARRFWAAEDRTVPLPSPPYGARRASASPLSRRVALPPDPALWSRIDAAAARDGGALLTADLTRFAALLTAFAGALSRITGDSTVAIGVPVHNRRTLADRETFGLLVDVLPLEIEVGTGDTWRSLRHKVGTAVGELLRNARPGTSSPDAARRCGYALNFVRASFGRFAGAATRIEWLHPGAHDPRQPIRLHVTDFSDSGVPELSFDLNEILGAGGYADRVPGQVRMALEDSIADPDRLVSAAPLAGPEEAAAVARACDGPVEPERTGDTVLDAFRRQVARAPRAEAVTCGELRLSYAELDARSDRVAARLAAAGHRHGDPVLLFGPRSPELVAGFLGILKAGGAAVPAAAVTPSARLAEIARQSGAHLALTGSEGAAAVHGIGVTPIRLESGADVPPTDPALPGADDTAYMIFTSGSTGVPKGVAVSHRELLRYAHWAAREFGHGPARYALFSSLSFDLTITSIFAPLVSGGSLRVYPETGSPDLAVLNVVREDAVEVLKLTPSHLALACASGARVQRIRTLVLGGETLTTALCQRARASLSHDLEIINEYGPTEAVVGCMIHRFDPGHDTDASVPIGRPSDGVRISIRDSGLGLAPFGVVGEICIGGRLATGYHGRADLTGERFVPDPLAPGARLYRSGDLGRLRPSGVFEYLGRADMQVKVGGARIELAEIEAAALSVPGVTAVKVIDGADKTRAMPRAEQHCTRCGLPETYPGTAFDAEGVCNTCREFERYRDRAQSYFKTPDALAERLKAARDRATGAYDAIMLLSGGKDSTYAAYRLARMTDRVLALTLDNGYLSETAMANVRRVSEELGWDHRFLTTEAMNAIFVDSLKTYANVCQGCFKTIYTLALRTAHAERVPAIVTGLSRGQFFETRLTPEMFRSAAPSAEEIDAIVAEARRSYHDHADAVTRLLPRGDRLDTELLGEVEFIDIYRFIDVPVSEIYRFLTEETAWVRPPDTGRSTNCLMNEVGIYVHRQRKGFHNYALPYSWDVRMGHKTRDTALAELDDEIDAGRVREILDEIGFDEPIEGPPAGLALYAACAAGVDAPMIWDALRARLLPEQLPQTVVVLDEIPLTDNGKVDTDRLPGLSAGTGRGTAAFRAPSTEAEHRFAGFFREVLRLEAVGVEDDFHDLGGDSLAAIQIAILANDAGIPLPPTALFSHPTIARLAAAYGAPTATRVDTAAEDAPLLDLDDADLDAVARALS